MKFLKILKRVETYCHNKRILMAIKMIRKDTKKFSKFEQQYAETIAELKQYTE